MMYMSYISLLGGQHKYHDFDILTESMRLHLNEKIKNHFGCTNLFHINLSTVLI